MPELPRRDAASYERESSILKPIFTSTWKTTRPLTKPPRMFLTSNQSILRRVCPALSGITNRLMDAVFGDPNHIDDRVGLVSHRIPPFGHEYAVNSIEPRSSISRISNFASAA
jgi:hypothetical protein